MKKIALIFTILHHIIKPSAWYGLARLYNFDSHLSRGACEHFVRLVPLFWLYGCKIRVLHHHTLVQIVINTWDSNPPKSYAVSTSFRGCTVSAPPPLHTVYHIDYKTIKMCLTLISTNFYKTEKQRSTPDNLQCLV